MIKKINNEIKTYINWINYDTEKCDLPSNQNSACKSLDGMMRLIFTLLQKINFDGPLYLDDDSIIAGIKTLLPRLLTDKRSIYEKYGFKISNEANEKLKQYISDLKNTKVDGELVSTGINEQFRGLNFKSTMGDYIRQLRQNSGKTTYIVEKLHEGMKLDNYKQYPTDCKIINQKGADYYVKYKKYKNKYLSLKNKLK